MNLNEFRKNPKLLAKHIESLKRYLDKNTNVLSEPGKIQIQMVEGEYVFNEAINFLNSLPSLKPLIWEESLALSALEHVLDIGPKGLLSYQSSDGTEPEERILKYGNYTESLGENIDFGPNDAMGVIISLTLDDGEEDRPHRDNLFKPDYQKVGIACGPHKTEYQMCVMDFAYDFEGFHDEPSDYSRKNLHNSEKLSPELGPRNIADLSMNNDKKIPIKNNLDTSLNKESGKFMDPLATANFSNSTLNANKNKNPNYNVNVISSNNNPYEDTFGNRNVKNANPIVNNLGVNNANSNPLKENIKTQANTNSLNNYQSPLVRLSLDKDEFKNVQKAQEDVTGEIDNLTEMVKQINSGKRVVSKNVEVTTKIVYTFEDGSTKEVVEKQNHTFAIDNN
jgi:uncharacterized protein YkwD